MLNLLIAIVIFGCVALIVLCFSNKREQERFVDLAAWIESREELIDSRIVCDTQSLQHLKVLTRVDSHGKVFAIDLLTLNNHAYECIRSIDKFDTRRFRKVI